MPAPRLGGRLTKIFLSYAHEDRDRAARLAAELERVGFTVWWDRMIAPGAEFALDTEKELAAADAVVVAWSRHSIGSAWVRDEAGVARDKGNLFPILIDAIEPPLGFRQFQTIDLSKWRGNPSSELTECVAILRRRFADSISTPVPTAPPPASRRWTRPVVLAALALATIAVAVGAFMALDEKRIDKVPLPAQAAAPTASASIAVLPFADLSAEADQQYFSDGIAEELLNVLAKVNGLKVASRTSSFRFRDAAVGAPEIADELQVRYLLEGSVRRLGDRVRITAQLIDAGDDRHLWSEVYDRPLTAENAFDIQEDIANTVVSELAARIGVTASAVKVEADTASLAAYELYLKGRALFALRGTQNLVDAARALEEATSVDPRFARAWEALAMTYAVSDSWGVTDRDHRRLALDAADRAEQLDRSLSVPYAVRGSVIFDMIGFGESDDWQTSLSNLSEAIERDPKNATAWFWRGIDYVVLGFFDRAIADIGRCVEIDPAYAYCGKWLAFAHLLAGHEDKALLLYARNKEAVFASEAAFAAAYVRRGDHRAANSILAAQYADVPELVPALFRALTDPAFSNADRRNALALINEERPANGGTAARFFLGDHSDAGNGIHTVLWWLRDHERNSTSTERKAQMRRFHLPDYWRAHEFPPQCRPVGVDDFECG